MVVCNLVFTAQYKRDYKRMKKRTVKIDDIFPLLERLTKQALLPKDKDHALKGEYHGYRECHIRSDWVLVYRYQGSNIVELYRTGTHQDIFKKKY